MSKSGQGSKMPCCSVAQIESTKHMAQRNCWPLSDYAWFLGMKKGAFYIEVVNLQWTESASPPQLLIIYGQVSRIQVRTWTMALDTHLAGWCLLRRNSNGSPCLATVHPGYKSKGTSQNVYKSVKAAKRVLPGRISFLLHPRLTYRVPNPTKVIKTLHWGYGRSMIRNCNPGNIPGSV